MTSRNWPIDKIMSEIKEKYIKEHIDAYWEDEKGAIKEALIALNKLLNNRFFPKEVLGVGGSGIVIRLEDSLFTNIDKAIKFPRPVPGKIIILTEMLDKEVMFLSELRHQGIVRIISYNSLENVDKYNKLPFYIMEYIDGTSTNKLFNKNNITQQKFNEIVLKTVEIFSFLHSHKPHGFVHLDIKAENILVDSFGQPILIDLGTCKQIKNDVGKTIIACTRPFAHPELVQLLADDPSDDNRAKGDVPRAQIKEVWDLWSFGCTLLQWLGINFDNGSTTKTSLYNNLDAYTRKFYLLLISRLTTYSLKDWLIERVGLSTSFLKEFAILSAVELFDILKRLSNIESPIDKIPEMKKWHPKTIQAAPNMHVPLTNGMTQVLNHRLYQRLNTISQLGLAYQVYPSAKHTRREHSLGTYANTRHLLRALYDDSYSPLFKQLITEEDCRVILLTALLHDVGQFPLSHELEDIEHRVFNHGELTRAMLKGTLEKKKKGSRKIKFESFDEVFIAWSDFRQGEDDEARAKRFAKRIENVLLAKPKNTSATRKDMMLRSIISGPIDADKLDYLFRDARHTDVPYPNGVDVERLLRCLTMIVVEKVKGINDGDIPALGVHAKGKIAAEFLTLSRYAMFSQVYWHHAVRSHKAMLSRAVHALLSSFSKDEDREKFKSDFIEMIISLPESLYQDTQTDLFSDEFKTDRKNQFGRFGAGTVLLPTDAAVLSWLMNELNTKNRPEERLIKGILQRQLFKRLWVLSHDMDIERWKIITEQWDKLENYKKYRLSNEYESALSKEIQKEDIPHVTTISSKDAKKRILDYTKAEIPWIVIDVPEARSGSELGLYYVQETQRRRLRKDDRVVADLQRSKIWEEYALDLRKAVGSIRIFCDPLLTDAIESAIHMDKGLTILENVINEL